MISGVLTAKDQFLNALHFCLKMFKAPLLVNRNAAVLHQEKLSDWISVLQERSENIEDLVSELELAYNSVEVKHDMSETHLIVKEIIT